MADLEKLYKKTGGFIKGICHPSADREGLEEIGIGWVRRDIPYPYAADGSETPSFAAYRERCGYYAEKGIYTIAITPYPKAFIASGVDPRTKEGLKRTEDICAEMAAALRGTVRCWQVTNEMFVPNFRGPLTAEESVDFIIACFKGLRRGDPDGCIGHNSCNAEWLPSCLEIERQVGGSDYIGLDCYAGTWGPGDTESYMKEIDDIYSMLGLPVILMEFGYSSSGRVVSDTDGSEMREISAYLKAHGFADLDDARARVDEFMEVVPPVLRKWAEACSDADRANFLFGSFTHILKYWHWDGGFTHTEDGQAAFYAKLLPMLLSHPHLGGAVIYCWQDSKTCFTCGQDDCPCETAWGLLRLDGTKKPAYYAVGKAFK